MRLKEGTGNKAGPETILQKFTTSRAHYLREAERQSQRLSRGIPEGLPQSNFTIILAEIVLDVAKPSQGRAAVQKSAARFKFASLEKVPDLSKPRLADGFAVCPLG